MKIKTKSGVYITIDSNGSSQIVFFDRPVRAIELAKDETWKISSSLVNDGYELDELTKRETHGAKDVSNIVSEVEMEAKQYMENHHFSGHDFAHVLRVRKLCEIIGQKENADMSILLAAALLHDLGRDHERKDPTIDHAEKSAEIAEEILNKVGFTPDKIPGVVYAIKVHRFSGKVVPTTLEAKILQDADRIDISGAVGIASTFAYGGIHGSEMYDVDDPLAESRDLDDNSYTLDHFYSKLLHLPETMHTKIGREVANRRREFTRHFLDEFRAEIEGKE